MPVTIQLTGLKYKNSQGQFQSADCLKGEDADISIIAPDYSELTFPVNAGKLCTHDLKLYRAKQGIPTSENWTESHWDERTIEEELAAKYTKPAGGIPATDLADGVIPDIIDDEAGAGDTDVTFSADKLTSEFDALSNAITNSPQITESDKSGVSLDVTDNNGYVLMRLTDGHIKTKNFDSSVQKVNENQGTQNARKLMVVSDAGEVEAQTVPNSIAGVVQIDENNTDLDITDGNGNVIFRIEDGLIKTYSQTIGYHKITLKTDGTGDFTSLRAAVESINDADSLSNPYVIEIYEGTYDVYADYTVEEINETGFRGLLISDGINLKGIGNRDNIIILGELDTETYTEEKRGDISTLDMADTASLENLTIIARNIRYCVHDDYAPTRAYYYRYVRSCKFRIYDPTSGSRLKTWGDGSRQGKITYIEDCDFGTCFAWHSDNQGNATRATRLTLKNCTAFLAQIYCNNHSVQHQVYLYNNNFAFIDHIFNNVSSTTKRMDVNGTGHGAMTSAPADWNYTNGDIVRFRNNGTSQLQVGQMVIPYTSPYWASGPLTAVTDPLVAYGVIVGADSEWFYVQKDGYININRFGFSSLSIGDKITADQYGILEVNGSGDTFGVVCCATDSLGTYLRRV